MKKLLFWAVLLYSASAFAQTIPEPGFETWSTGGPFQAPSGWAVSPGVIKSPDAHSGSWALQCTVDTFTNPITSTLDTVPAMAYTGAATMGPPPPGGNFGGYAYVGPMADSFIGYYKFQGMGGDSMVITAYFSYWDTITHHRSIIKQGRFSTGASASTYTRFSVPVDLLGTWHMPDTAFVQVTAANPQQPFHMGTSVIVDDVSFFTFPDAVAAVSKASVNIYPNPFEDHLTVDGVTVKRVSMLNAIGQVVAESSNRDLYTGSLPAGIYIVNITTSDGQLVTQKIERR